MTWLWAIPLGIMALLGMVKFFESRGAMQYRLRSSLAALTTHSRINRVRKKIKNEIKKRQRNIDPHDPDIFG
jgi:hypothetical protein|tara:strand:- start:261 stop:476 length:216 start_codon:yes stop_codon:yes gene_type:complete